MEIVINSTDIATMIDHAVMCWIPLTVLVVGALAVIGVAISSRAHEE
jgi:hypothetical protein